MAHHIPAAETEIMDHTFFPPNTEICQLEPGTGSTKGTCEEEEENEDETYSSLNEDYNSSDSENESSSLQRRKDLSSGKFLFFFFLKKAILEHSVFEVYDELDKSHSA